MGPAAVEEAADMMGEDVTTEAEAMDKGTNNERGSATQSRLNKF